METPIEKPTDTVHEAKDKKFRDTWQPRLSLLISLAAIIISVFLLISKEAGSLSDLMGHIYDKGQPIINVCNVIVALIAFFFIAKHNPAFFSVDDTTKFMKLAEQDPNDDSVKIYVANLNNRVWKLVNQFRLHMILFAFSLVLTYGVMILPAKPNDGTSISCLRVITNLLNFSGALFVHLGFNVLYNKTLDFETDKPQSKSAANRNNIEKEQNVTYNSSLYWGVPVLFVVVYAVIFVTLSIFYSGRASEGIRHFLNSWDLVAGLANGLTMTLLFGRYVSIEQSLRKTQKFEKVFEYIFYPFTTTPYKAIVSFGITFILPIYALAQPLFGSLQIDAFGDPQHFQTTVYTVCLVGKVCFFHLTYLLITKGLLHLYLYGVVSEVGNFEELERCFQKDDNRA